MNKRTIIGVVLVLTVPLGIGLFLLLHQPQKPVSHHQTHRVMDNAHRITEFVGVGLMLRNGAGGGTVVIDHVMPNSPAAEAHITSGLIVSKVDDVSLEGKLLADCVKLIRGPVGSTMQLELVKPDHSQTNTVELTRRKITISF